MDDGEVLRGASERDVKRSLPLWHLGHNRCWLDDHHAVELEALGQRGWNNRDWFVDAIDAGVADLKARLAKRDENRVDHRGGSDHGDGAKAVDLAVDFLGRTI